MKANRIPLVLLLRGSFLLALCCSASGPAAQSPAKSPPADNQIEVQKAAFKLLDELYGRIEILLEKVDDPQVKAAAKASFDALKERREALRKNFVQSTYDDLKYDATIDHHRLASWLNDPSVKRLPGSESSNTASKERGSAKK